MLPLKGDCTLERPSHCFHTVKWYLLKSLAADFEDSVIHFVVMVEAVVEARANQIHLVANFDRDLMKGRRRESRIRTS